MLKKIFHVLLVAAGAAGIAATIVALSVSSGVTIGTVMPAGAGALLIAYGLWHLLKKKLIIKNKALRVAVVTIVCLGLALFAFVETLIVAQALSPVPDRDAGFVVVLGCGIFPDGHLSQSLVNRLSAAREYLYAHPDALCIVSGGQGENEPMPEAQAMKNYLVAKGIDKSRVLMETRSTSTEENLSFSMEIMQKYPQQSRIIAIVTSDYHVFRTQMIARRMGLDAFGIPSKTPAKVAVSSYMREFLAVINTTLFGIRSGIPFLGNL